MATTSYYKVGITQDSELRNRVAQLQTGNPFEIQVIKLVEYKPAKKLETAIHEALKVYHVRGEWFYGPLSAIERIFDITFTMFRVDVLLDDDHDDVHTMVQSIDTREDLIQMLIIAGKNNSWIKQHVRGRDEDVLKEIVKLRSIT